MPPPPPFPSKSKKDAVRSFLKISNLLTRLRRPRQKGDCHSFDHALRVCYDTIKLDKMSFSNNQSLIYRYHNLPNNRLTPGMASALMDELSTQALASSANPPGASVFLQTQWFFSGKQPGALKQHEYIDVINSVTKCGRTLAHTKTDFLTPENELIGHSIHIKYLPTGNFFLDMLFKYYPPWMSTLLSKLISHWIPPPKPPTALPSSNTSNAYTLIQEHVQFAKTPGQAVFVPIDDHTNPMGAVHGGCISMLFELIAAPYAKSQLAEKEVSLESIQIQFLSAARPRGELKVACETVKAVDGSHILVRVSLTKDKKSKDNGSKKNTPQGETDSSSVVLAQGTLKFVGQ